MLPIPQSRKSILTGAVALGIVVVAILVIVLWRWQKAKPAAVATYVGQERCAQCHAEQVQAWRTSHHAQAMRVADDSTVLGNFNDAHFAKEGLSSSFFKKDGKFYVRTEGPDGKPQVYELTCTFGRISPAAISRPISQRPAAELCGGLGFAEQGTRRPTLV